MRRFRPYRCRRCPPLCYRRCRRFRFRPHHRFGCQQRRRIGCRRCHLSGFRRPPKTRRSLLFQHGRQRWGYRRCQRRRPSSLPGLARRRWRKTRRSERKNGVVAIASRAAPSIVQTMSTRKSARRASIAQFDRWTRHSFWYFIEARGIVRTPSVREFKEYKLSLKYGLPVVLFIRRAQALGIMAVFTRGFCFMRQVL